MAYTRNDARFRDTHFDTAIDLVGDPDDPPVRDVPEEAVDHFQRYGWELVDDTAASDDTADDADADADSGSDSDAEESTDDSEFDAEAFVDRNVPPVAEDLDTGDYDDHLEAIEAAESADGSPRNGVVEAIEARRSDAE